MTTVYIRPCGALPDGLEFDSALVDRLRAKGLIEESEVWPADYEAIYDVWDEAHGDHVAAAIFDIVEGRSP